ncbi:MAG TPA: hypothetical protein PKC18_03150, partial [Lacipirellulaceae bacterium]|nr:hypothetical protein [Lacipirellulaceae bacterium]
VGEYQFVDTESNLSGDIARVWINPTPGDFSAQATPSAVDDNPDSLNMQGQLPIGSFHLRNDTNTPGNVLVDEIRIGTTFADVLPAAAIGLAGDFNGDLTVDGADFLLWQRGETPSPFSSDELQAWMTNFGAPGGASSSIAAIPEPTAVHLAAMTCTLLLSLGVRRRRLAAPR